MNQQAAPAVAVSRRGPVLVAQMASPPPAIQISPPPVRSWERGNLDNASG